MPMRKPPCTGVLALLIACVVGLQLDAAGVRLRAVVAGVELPPGSVRSVVVESDTLGVDAATIVLDVARAGGPKVGDALSISAENANDPQPSIFNGEIIGIEPAYSTRGATTVTLRAFNRLHRLMRGRHSRTFESMSDADIAARMANEAGLGFGPSGPEATIKHKHVVQYAESNLEFLRTRAAGIGYEVVVEDSTLYFRRAQESAEVALGCTLDAGRARYETCTFRPRLSSASAVKKVTVRGWDPEKKREIIGEATRRIIPLSPAAARVMEPPGMSLDLGFVPALAGEAAAYGAASGTLAALTALDLSAEADTDGNASLRAGGGVILTESSRRFGGKYLIIGASHRYERGSTEGWHTLLRLVRTDRGVYLLPEIGDEVLLAFEHGDIRYPYVVGSLWNR